MKHVICLKSMQQDKTPQKRGKMWNQNKDTATKRQSASASLVRLIAWSTSLKVSRNSCRVMKPSRFKSIERASSSIVLGGIGEGRYCDSSSHVVENSSIETVPEKSINRILAPWDYCRIRLIVPSKMKKKYPHFAQLCSNATKWHHATECLLFFLAKYE